MPRPPRRTAASRRSERETAASKLVHVDSPAPTFTIPSSPPLTRRTRISNITKSASVLSLTSDVDVIPSTQPLSNTITESSGTPSHVSENTITRANYAASARKIGPTINIEVSRTPSPGPQFQVENILATSTPTNVIRGKKRNSRTAFEEDFAASLIAAEDSDGDENAMPDTPSKSSGIKKRRLSQERVPTGFSDGVPGLLNVMGNTTADKGKRVRNPDETITFNYSSSPERSPAPKTFGVLQILEDSDSEPEEEEEETDENEPAPEEIIPSRPRRKRPIGESLLQEQEQEQEPRHPSTKALQSLLPRRRAKPKAILKTKTKSKVTKEPVRDKGKAPAKSRAALGDVTKDILDDDELQAIDAPPKPMFGAGMDILSDDELGREIYVDTSARSSSVGAAPPTPASPPRRATRGGKGKARAVSAEPEAALRPKKTYGKPRRQDSEVSNKENDTPAPGRSRGNLLSAVSKLAVAANVELSKKEKKEVADIRQKFKEVDDWDLCFEDVVPSSSDGVVRNGR
ncbi:hypothetical protein TWF225_000170 [Orbilia oligospora]|nr:hypothetical protein TWF225_000170 [Orbilia oligospora]KAF3235116.1 hypothetical protein TWF128_002111 [Orbilia oligospora]KAF3259945.1 hypothetical protein TWF217_004976 [Orbilia oligospora]KAF3297537.1 hypothetical protein TWF132_005961 [Orbilia oligospora]